MLKQELDEEQVMLCLKMIGHFAERSHTAEELVICLAPQVVAHTLCRHKQNRDLMKLGFEALGKLVSTRQCAQELMKLQVRDDLHEVSPSPSMDPEPSTTMELMKRMKEIMEDGIENGNSQCITNSLSFFIKLLQYDETAMLVVDHCIPFLFETINRKKISNIVALLTADIFDRLTKSNQDVLQAFLEYENCCGFILAFIEFKFTHKHNICVHVNKTNKPSKLLHDA
ncbi:hypothetical protein RFI_14544 [Reticulomyxa filosa]|uniref:Uncharacterized protein n=1 Tax=Reticulomyxa filosa TaxID=46433 RepID=X6NBF1_RETFI|nr:hypothetical protein RFI_14544 [Reticulomyxa filosa]|eukprot:ETO22647.1 hypothetical protein RFI_14544 [Reticulomyxa filosa]